MTHKQLAALFFLLMAGMVVMSFLRRSKAKVGDSIPAEGWQAYDGSGIRLQYPKDWVVVQAKKPAPGRHVWYVVVPPTGKPFVDEAGNIHIYEYIDGKEKRPLEEIYSSQKWRETRLTNAPKKVNLKNSRCIAYPMETRDGDLLLAHIRTYCYRDNGDFVEVWADLGRYREPGKPSEQALRNALIYERVLSSIEFL